MDINEFAPNLSFFFSNGMDPEYTVIGRVARRIWSVTMRDLYSANERSQKLKYHIQTSGRSLHAREIQFNDIRTTLQALLALYDNCNSLHTNAYDEAITTPTEESVRRAMAIQKIINWEFGLLQNENALQGSYIVEELTDLVEEAVLKEFERIDDRGGVLGAMETQYQRGKIQEESLYYEMRKHSGDLPIIGINTFLDPNTTHDNWEPPTVELRRATPAEKQDQIDRLHVFQDKHASETDAALEDLRQTALQNGNIFASLMRAVRVASLGQITQQLYTIGGEYRRIVTALRPLPLQFTMVPSICQRIQTHWSYQLSRRINTSEDRAVFLHRVQLELEFLLMQPYIVYTTRTGNQKTASPYKTIFIAEESESPCFPKSDTTVRTSVRICSRVDTGLPFVKCWS